MNKNLHAYVPLAAALTVIALDYLALWCLDGGAACASSGLRQFYEAALDPAYAFALSALIPCLIVPFVPKTALKAWLLFSCIWLLGTILLIATASAHPQTGGALHLYAETKIIDARVMGEMFAVISILLLAARSWAARPV
ncbi:MAG TPA: hypothetical protein VF439_01410 [Candidatus Paceibacterota bacterium]